MAEAETAFQEVFRSPKYKNVRVEEVLAIDLFRLTSGEKVKLIGIKAPDDFEKPHRRVERNEYGMIIKEPISPADSLEEEALQYVQELLTNQNVRIELDAQSVDDADHTLGYVFLVNNNLFVNAEILRQGYAHLQISPPNLEYADQLREAYQEARRERRGLQNE